MLMHQSVDVANMESLERGFASFSTDFNGRLDICVPCAGINRNVSFLKTPIEDHQRLIAVNVIGVYHTAQLAAKQMIKNRTNKGSIILIASIASQMAIRSQGSSAYCGTKGAVKAMCPPIAAELNKYGIRCNTLSPGYVWTEMTAAVRDALQTLMREKLTPAQYPELVEGWKDEIMNHRLAIPDDIRGGCVFLASDASSYMTGQDLCIDGGVTKW
jgi:NAD(P)-dependent dehydrogenase (short-subunit alcohol dehydrogenase family)